MLSTHAFLIATVSALIGLLIALPLRHALRASRYAVLPNLLGFIAHSVLIAGLAFFCLVCFQIIVKVAINNNNFFAVPFIRMVGAFLPLPLILLLIQSAHFYVRPYSKPFYRATALYLAALTVYLGCLHFGLILLGMVAPGTVATIIMGTVSLLSAVFYLYTYRRFRRVLG